MLSFRTRSCALASLALVLTLSREGVAQCGYDVFPISVPNGQYIVAEGLNNLGQVAVSNGDELFIWSRQTGAVPLPNPNGGAPMVPSDLNDAGWVVGRIAGIGFVWNGVEYALIGEEFEGPRVEVDAINSYGQIVGQRQFDPPMRAFLWENGADSDLGPALGNPTSYYAFGLNDRGQIVGGLNQTGQLLAYRLDDTGVALLPMPSGYFYSLASAINQSGVVVGQANNGRYAGMIWRPDGSFEAVRVPSLNLVFVAVNDQNRVLGYSPFVPAPQRAVVWQNGQLWYLNDLLLPPAPPRPITRARDINRRGEILALDEANDPVLLVPDWLAGDVTGDCHVTLADLLAVLGDFGCSDPDCGPGDADFDGDADLADLTLVLGNFGRRYAR